MIKPATNLQLGGSFTEGAYQMFSGQELAESCTYHIAIGKSKRIWLYSTGDNIYVQGGPSSDGFGGRTLTFQLANGCNSIKLKGPWHSNSKSLLDDTGIDITNQHLTYGVIGKRRTHKGSLQVIEDLIWFDNEPTYGQYDRVIKLAEKLSNERQETLYYHMQSISGGSCGPVNYNKFN